MTIGLLLSGGLDSGILLGSLLRQGHRVQPLYVDSGLIWQAAEMAALASFLETFESDSLERLAVLHMPLDDLYRDHWSLTGKGVPSHTSPDEAMYLPGRNPLLLVKAVLWCHNRGVDRLAIAVLDSSPFADAKREFLEPFQGAMERALGRRVAILCPLAGLTKVQVMAMGTEMALERTFSCVAPVGELHCGRCNKCAERREALRQSGIGDPTEYATDLVAAG